MPIHNDNTLDEKLKIQRRPSEILTKSSKLGNSLMAFGVAGGLLYGLSKGKTPLQIGVWSVALGFSGYIIGNAITKFYE